MVVPNRNILGRRDRRLAPQGLLRRGSWCGGAEHGNLRADWGPIAKVSDVVIGHADATGRYVLADGPRLVGAVDPV